MNNLEFAKSFTQKTINLMKLAVESKPLFDDDDKFIEFLSRESNLEPCRVMALLTWAFRGLDELESLKK